MSTLVRLKHTAPDDATHYRPDSEIDYECWAKPGHSMIFDSQSDWVKDSVIDIDIRQGRAFEIVRENA